MTPRTTAWERFVMSILFASVMEIYETDPNSQRSQYASIAHLNWTYTVGQNQTQSANPKHVENNKSEGAI